MDRQDYLGGTDIAAICGESQFANIHDVWLEKMGLIDSRVSSIMMEVGTHMESYIAKKYEERTGLALMTAPPLTHPEFAFVGGHPDRHIVNDKGFVGVNELKNITFQKHKWGDDGTTNCPTGYQIQAMWYAGVLHAINKSSERVDLTALIGNQDLRIYSIGWQEELYEALLKHGIHFWNTYILPARKAKAKGKDFAVFAPPVDETESAARMIAAIWPQSKEIEMEADGEIEHLAIEETVTRRLIEKESATLRGIHTKIQERMGEAGVLTTAQGRYTWTTCKGKTKWKGVAEDILAKYIDAERSKEYAEGIYAELLSRNTGKVSRTFRKPPLEKENGDG